MWNSCVFLVVLLTVLFAFSVVLDLAVMYFPIYVMLAYLFFFFRTCDIKNFNMVAFKTVFMGKEEASLAYK